MARYKTKTEIALHAVLNNPDSTPAELLKAAQLLDEYKKRREHRRRHTKAKALLGLGAREKVTAAPPGSVKTRELIYSDNPAYGEKNFRIVAISEGAKVYPPATPVELAAAKELAAKAEANRPSWTEKLEALLAKFVPAKN